MPRVTITVPEKASQPYRFQLDRSSVTLGRGSENDIVINCGSVSVNHAEMRRVPGGYELRDLGSTNGIKIYGARQQVIQLRNGIPVKLGDVLFDFLLSDDELTALESERAKTKPAEPPAPVDDSDWHLQPPTVFPEEPKAAEPQAPEPKAPEPKAPEPKAPEPEAVEVDDLDPESEKSPSGGSGCTMILLFLVLAAAAFFAGMEIRSRYDTGKSLIDTLKAKFEASLTKEKPASKSDETPAAPNQP